MQGSADIGNVPQTCNIAADIDIVFAPWHELPAPYHSQIVNKTKPTAQGHYPIAAISKIGGIS